MFAKDLDYRFTVLTYPNFAGTVPVVAATTWASRHVDHDGGRTMRPLSPCGLDLVTRRNACCLAGSKGTSIIAADLNRL